MEETLGEEEVRVLGSLVEKQLTTPEYYPLTLNSLVNACNQLSNRDPVVSYDQSVVLGALDGLRAKRLAHVVYGADSRVPKYKHTLMEALNFTRQQELAVMCVLMLRGPQTAGEIRARSGRLFAFKEVSDVEASLEELMKREGGPLVARLPRQPGQKEVRYAHLLSGEVRVEEHEAPSLSSSPTPPEREGERQRVARLEAEVAALRAEVSELARRFDEFKKQFE